MNRALIMISGFLLILFVGSTLAQRPSKGITPGLQFAEDTRINPHDFTNEYYVLNGINPKGIIGRRTGTDGLSVFSNSSNPFHTNVRVLATMPAYDQNGDMIFWFPLGELQDYGFTEDKAGELAREVAMRFPIYVFPDTKILSYRTLADSRQAVLMDNSWSGTNGQDVNMLGLRAIVVVSYTEKAFSKEGLEMMGYFRQKNGAAADDTPIIRTMEDMNILAKNEMIEMSSQKMVGGKYAIATPIFDPTQGAIAPDAFILMATKDGRHLPAEDMFVWQFHCLQKTGYWCTK